MGATVIIKENECSTKEQEEDDVNEKKEYYLKFSENQNKWINVIMEKKKKFSFQNAYNTFIQFYTDKKQMVYEKYNLNRYITCFSNILLLFFMIFEFFISSCKTVVQIIKHNTKEVLLYSFNKCMLTSKSIYDLSILPLQQYYKSVVDKVSSTLKGKTESLLLIKKKIQLQYNDVRVFIQETVENITVYILSKCEFYKSKIFFNPFGKL